MHSLEQIQQYIETKWSIRDTGIMQCYVVSTDVEYIIHVMMNYPYLYDAELIFPIARLVRS